MAVAGMGGRSVGDAELSVDTAQVGLCGAVADMKRPDDRLDCEAVGGKFKCLLLARCEAMAGELRV